MAIYKDVASLEVVGYTEPKGGTFSDGVQFILEKLDAIPEADAEPVRHGHWIVGMDFSDGTGAFICSLCGHAEKWNEPYCNCGAKMDGKENEL